MEGILVNASTCHADCMVVELADWQSHSQVPFRRKDSSCLHKLPRPKPKSMSHEAALSGQLVSAATCLTNASRGCHYLATASRSCRGGCAPGRAEPQGARRRVPLVRAAAAALRARGGRAAAARPRRGQPRAGDSGVLGVGRAAAMVTVATVAAGETWVLCSAATTAPTTATTSGCST